LAAGCPQLCSRLTDEIEQYKLPVSSSKQQQHHPGAAAGSSGAAAAAEAASFSHQLEQAKQQLADVQQQLKDTQTDANNTIGMLRQQLQESRTAGGETKGQVADAKAALLVEQAAAANLRLRLEDAKAHEGHLAAMKDRLEAANARLRDDLTRVCCWLLPPPLLLLLLGLVGGGSLPGLIAATDPGGATGIRRAAELS